jgi:hypothetical protein
VRRRFFQEGLQGTLTFHSTLGPIQIAGVKLDEAQVERRRHTAQEMNLGQYIQPCPSPNGSRPWTADELALLATLDDEAVAARTGRSPNAVRVKRQRVNRRG